MTAGAKQNWLPADSGPNAENKSLRGFGLLLFQLLLTGSLLLFYEIEANNGLKILLPFFAGAILINYWLPARFRPAFFTLTAWTCLLYALGWFSGLLAIAVTLLYFGIAHLRINTWFRLSGIAGLTAALIVARLQLIYMPHLLVAVPVLGTMLMFRFLLYLYELKHEKQGASWTERLSYFFNPLNLVFPLFPILDYKTWLRALYNDVPENIFARATRRILLGILQLLLYRWIYLHLPNPSTLQNAQELALFVLGGYTLILRMLGIFWIAIGLLGYFGYNLPPVFNNAFFITSFGEIWRKINIYWRDFVTKIFYYEIYFKLRKKTKQAVLASALLVFVITWLLHGWQWFWLRGDFNFRLTDVLYWLLLGTCIAVNLAREEKQGTAPARGNTLAASFLFMLRVLLMFFAMSFLWSLWNSATPGEWFFLLGKISREPSGLLPVAAALAAIVITGAGIHYFIVQRKSVNVLSPSRTYLAAVLVLALLLPPVLPQLNGKLPEALRTAWSDFSRPKLNQFDRENAEQGYYEMLVDSRGASPWEQHVNVRGRGQWFSKAELPVDDLRKRTLKPNMRLSNGKAVFTTNSRGMRSPEFDSVKPGFVLRIAVLGGSYEMGSGVSDEEVFVRILEKKLNDSLQKAGDSLRVEILNFSAGAYHVPQFVWLCDSIVFKFRPDLLLCFAHSDELRRLNAVMAGLVKNGVDLRYDTLKAIKKRAGVDQKMSRTEIRNRLQPTNLRIYNWGYREKIGALVHANTTSACWVFLPTLNSPGPAGEFETLSRITENAGFSTISLEQVYGQFSQSDLQVQPDDNHPNATGHQLIAEALYHKIQRCLKSTIGNYHVRNYRSIH